ncbi:MAG: MiaB/RimO family radical SAM methylthiotransferase, partial [Odoribacter sp.]|nr:MiaB/RimO family radical SAM methylthiotransferase [Odoribacter sp.]
DYFCSYCTIPYARGRSRSADTGQILKAVREVADKGVKEIILTGVNTGDFGKGGTSNLLALIKQLDQMDEIERYRISSIEPNLLTHEIIEFVAGSRHFMPHFHIPLQSGNNEVLKLMRRRYTRELFAEKVNHIKSLLPDAFIGVDTIAGMRGETEDHFKDACDFIGQLNISRLHVFPYSERQGTKALQIPFSVPQEEKHRRVTELLAISDEKLHQFHQQCEGQTRPVLFEDTKVGEYICGFTDNYIKVQLPYDKMLANQIIPIHLQKDILTQEE